MAKLSPTDWVKAGINQLKEFGPQGISGEQVARRLDVTRGSFYHHFPSMDHYIELLIQEWETTQTIEVVNKAHEGGEVTEQMMSLMESAWNSDAELEIAMRQWAFSNKRVRESVERADRMRLAYIQAIYTTLVNDGTRGPKLGKLAYYGLLGALHRWPRIGKEELKNLILEIQDLLTNHQNET